MARNFVVAAAALILMGCQTAHKDAQFVIYSHGDIDAGEVAQVRSQLMVGLSALRQLPISLYENRFPITVHLYTTRGISNASGGQGPIHFYGVGRRNPAIVHELTHVLTGYQSLGGDAHWSSEGFASYMQDKHGRRSYPTRKRPHELAKLILERGQAMPVLNLLQAKNRTSYFNLKADLWTGWKAYVLSTSFTHYLIEKFTIQKFVKIYDRRSNSDQLGELNAIYGKQAKVLVAEWREFVTGLNSRMAPAERTFNFFSRIFR
jgi:hypothetical protein